MDLLDTFLTVDFVCSDFLPMYVVSVWEFRSFFSRADVLESFSERLNFYFRRTVKQTIDYHPLAYYKVGSS